jgi:hypothetical protein
MSDNNTQSNNFQQPKAPVFKILEKDPLIMSRPLALIEGKAYAAAWVKLEISVSEELDQNGKIIEHNPPITSIRDQKMIIREDSTYFNIGDPDNKLGFEVHLPEAPDPNTRWSSAGIASYLKGKRPNPIDIFDRLVQVIGRFIDFTNSLADPKAMCEFIACAIMSTWFLDAFNVAPYLWITGESGSGKTNLLIVITSLSYLGQFVSISGSFASLRDMADYGATLGLDDAESLTYSSFIDPNKQALLLSGNHKGAMITLKEQGPDRKWHNRHVNTYSARVYSAIGLPSSTLQSRSITILMNRTADRERGNTDPIDTKQWPHDQHQLRDDLWAMGLAHMAQLRDVNDWVGVNGKLIGRDLQPWRPILAVAKWLSQRGVAGLYFRMEALSQEYQKKRQELESPDKTKIIIQGLLLSAEKAVTANQAVSGSQYIIVNVDQVVGAIQEVIESGDLDIEPLFFNHRRIGHAMKRFGFKPVPRKNSQGSRTRQIYLPMLVQLASNYSVALPDGLQGFRQADLDSLATNGLNGQFGSKGKDSKNGSPKIDLARPQFCQNCHGTDFHQQDGGGWVCNICYPGQL